MPALAQSTATGQDFYRFVIGLVYTLAPPGKKVEKPC
jgi:hypothetical protein